MIEIVGNSETSDKHRGANSSNEPIRHEESAP
jgi:hypothetical protein